MANVQRMHNDLERSGENDRRRMDSQIKLLDDQKYAICFPTSATITGTHGAL